MMGNTIPTNKTPRSGIDWRALGWKVWEVAKWFIRIVIHEIIKKWIPILFGGTSLLVIGFIGGRIWQPALPFSATQFEVLQPQQLEPEGETEASARIFGATRRVLTEIPGERGIVAVDEFIGYIEVLLDADQQPEVQWTADCETGEIISTTMFVIMRSGDRCEVRLTLDGTVYGRCNIGPEP